MRNPCKKFVYIDKDGNPVYKNKIKYNTKDEARKKADEMNTQEHVIHQLAPYLCPKCHKWHIGRSTVEKTHYGKNKKSKIK